MADENIDGAVKWLMKRLMQTTAESFDLAFARYETSEREAALAQARRLMESEDPAERELGERLKAEVLKEQRHSSGLMLEGPERERSRSRPFVAFAVAILARRGYTVARVGAGADGEAARAGPAQVARRSRATRPQPSTGPRSVDLAGHRKS